MTTLLVGLFSQALNRTLLLFVVFIILSGALKAQIPNLPSESTFEQSGNMMLVPRGTKVWLPAPLGTDKSILGRAFNAQFLDKDANGQRYQAFKGSPRKIPLKAPYYNAEFRKLDTEELLSANARFFGMVNVGAKNTDRKRYALLSVYFIDKVDVFEPMGAALVNTDYYASKVYYGWAIHYLISGNEKIFTADVAANLDALTGVGGDFKLAISQNNLSQNLSIKGLNPKQPGQITYTPDQVADNFTFDKNNSSPIFVEYEAITSVPVTALSWASKKLELNRAYRISDIQCVAMERKEDGKEWDSKLISGSPAPDISVEIYVNNQSQKIASGPDNQYAMNVSPNISFFIDDSFEYLYFKVFDRDGLQNDLIGTAIIYKNDLLRFTERQWLSLATKGQLKSLLIQIE